MDQRERMDEGQEALATALDGRQAAIWTCLPGIIESFDADKQTAVVQPAIQGVRLKPDGTSEPVTLPLLLDCPVEFPSGGGATLTFPITKGDECEVVFASRCIDAWWQSGGVQPQAEARMHDLSDGFVRVGPRSQPRKLANVSTTATQLRSDDGTTFVALDPTAHTLALTAPSGATINANVTINGTLHVTGKITGDANIEAGGDVKAGAISLNSHHHTGVQTGSGNTGGPA